MAMTHEARISKIFRDAFQAHPARQSDPALALESARDTASESMPAGVTGRFDDERLTFTADYPIEIAREVSLRRPDLAAHDEIAVVLQSDPTLTADEVIATLDEARAEQDAEKAR